MNSLESTTEVPVEKETERDRFGVPIVHGALEPCFCHVLVPCPFCGQTHRHRTHGLNTTSGGRSSYRTAPCGKGKGRYAIVADALFVETSASDVPSMAAAKAAIQEFLDAAIAAPTCPSSTE